MWQAPAKRDTMLECAARKWWDLFGKSGAGNEARTRDLNLGKVALYQLSYSRPKQTRNCRAVPPGVKKNRARKAAKALNYPAIPATPSAGTESSTRGSGPPRPR
jgi:hypothetical protein